MYWFPYKRAREYQEDIARCVMETLKSRRHLVFSAPTGVGKTAAVESAVLKFANSNNLKVLYFTSRSSNQILPLKEFKLIKDKFCNSMYAGRITSKKDLCPRKGIDTKDLQTFYRLCSEKREKECEHYLKLREKLHDDGCGVFKKLVKDNPRAFFNMLDIGSSICTYYLVKKFIDRRASLIVLDYQYVLNPFIRRMFFGKHGIDLRNAILIFDECHNLPEKAREAASFRLSTRSFIATVREMNDYKDRFVANSRGRVKKELREELDAARELMAGFDRSISATIAAMTRDGDSVPFSLEELIGGLDAAKREAVEEALPTLEEIAELVEDDEKRSRCRAVHGFLTFLLEVEGDEKFVQFIEMKKVGEREYFSLNIKCLDPSFIFKPIMEECHSVICFSGTVYTESFKQLLGFPEDTVTATFPSPFSPEQRRYIVYGPEYANFTLKTRNKDVEHKCSDLAGIVNAMQGNVLVVFPSTDVFSIYVPQIEGKLNKRVFKRPFMLDFSSEHDYKKQRMETLKEFKKSKNGVLLTIAYGSYNEGVDYKGVLQNALIVGFPYPSVNYERTCLTNYFDEKFPGYGRFLASILPGIQKSIQSAGRVIRDEKDRGVIVFYGKQFRRGLWRYGRYFDLLLQEIKDEAIHPSEGEGLIEAIKLFWKEKKENCNLA